MSRFMIYGANGYTGRLITREAVRQGLKPVLAGRNRDALDAMAKEFGLTRRLFELSRVAETARNLQDVPLVLNCAGPFSQTCAPMLDSCLAVNAHYLDITGEISVFEHCHSVHVRAKRQRVIVAPGTGFDVVPTDCVAAMLKKTMPDARSLVLGFEAGGGPSPGTAKTGVEGIAAGGRARIKGEIVEVPLAWKTRDFVRDGMNRSAVSIPWGDLYTAWVSTGIPNIETYMTASPKAIQRMRWMRHLRPLLRLSAVQSYLKGRITAKNAGPTEQQRRESASYIWGEVNNARGKGAQLLIRTPNGYDLTASAAVGMVQHVLKHSGEGGYYTPSQLMGADYVLRLPGVRRIG
ncbi:MAG: saccharopine dehydrogenase NADP-binding domain-containing protein [Tahibacter sp.]